MFWKQDGYGLFYLNFHPQGSEEDKLWYIATYNHHYNRGIDYDLITQDAEIPLNWDIS